VITDLVQIRRLGEQKREDNRRFRLSLKTYRYVERRLRKLAEEVEEQIDCRVCANCCKVATARLLERDVERLAKHLRVTVSRFLADYTETNEDEGRVLKRTEESGCVFLSGNDCTVYEVRPAACNDFPHTVRGTGSIPARMWDLIDRACYCPMVYHTIEAWKKETGYTR
jgi:Fe-S-cluster containining protein